MGKDENLSFRACEYKLFGFLCKRKMSKFWGRIKGVKGDITSIPDLGKGR